MRNRNRVRKQITELLQAKGYTVDTTTLEELTAIALPEKPLTEHQRMIEALCKVMGCDVNLNAARVARFASDLLKVPVTPESIEKAYGPGSGYYRVDWRGKRGELPNERTIRETLTLAANNWSLSTVGAEPMSREEQIARARAAKLYAKP